jgi:hypothetical protein
MTRGAVVVAALVAGCGASMWASVPVTGSDASVGRLAGTWEGTFEGGGAGKARIQFALPQGSRYAEGQVTFNANEPAKATTVSIRQVNAGAEGKVAGVIGPYQEPQLKAQAQTAFVGTLQGDTITGTFTTRVIGSADAGQRGRWQMSRKQ